MATPETLRSAPATTSEGVYEFADADFGYRDISVRAEDAVAGDVPRAFSLGAN